MHFKPFTLERFYADYEFTTEVVLCSSDCETRSVRTLLAGAPEFEKRLFDLRLGYSPMPGIPDLRAAIASMYEHVTPDDIIVTTGGGCAIEILCRAALEPGDHVVGVTPCYESAAELPRQLGCEVSEIALEDGDDGWFLDLDRLERLLERPTRLIAINLPHNPTGYMMTPDVFARFKTIVDHSRAIVFCDEIFRGMEHAETWRSPAGADAFERGVSLGAMSKTFGLPGLRLGWLVMRDRVLFDACMAHLDYSSKDAPAPSQLLALAALRQRASIHDENKRLATANLELLRAFMAGHEDRFTWHEPRAGVVAFPKLRSGPHAFELHEELVNGEGVLLAPGSLFGATNDYFRIGFGHGNFGNGLGRVERYLAGARAGAV